MECFFKEIDVSTGTDLPFDTEKRYKCIQIWMHTVKGIDRNTDADTYTGMEIKRVRGREQTERTEMCVCVCVCIYVYMYTHMWTWIHG